MGKKDKSKKCKGTEKASAKVQKKLEKRLMKAEQCAEEQSIEEMLQEFQREQQKLTEVTCSITGPPTPRSHFSLSASPDTSELMIFGGEYFDGKKITMFSDVFLYNCKDATWTMVKSPTCPPPRSGHQAIFVKSNSIPASVWVFGGEYASPTQIRFYHYKDLWCFRMRTRKWELVQYGSVCASIIQFTDVTVPPLHLPEVDIECYFGNSLFYCSGDLMTLAGLCDFVCILGQLQWFFIYRKTVYFNDLWQFDLVSRRWTSLKISGDVPSPRSACLLFSSTDLKNIYLFGGYRKEQLTKDVERGVSCSDYFRLTLDKDGSVATSLSVRPSGLRPKPPRNAMAGVFHTANRALVFGGVHDVESEDAETVIGYFHNDLYTIELDKAKWHLFSYATARQTNPSEDKPPVESPTEDPVTTTQISEGAFTLTLNQDATKPSGAADSTKSSTTMSDCVVPPRSSAGMAILGSTLYIYGGVFEIGDRKVTLDDFYSLDLSQPVSWKRLFAGTQENQQWFGSDLEDDDDDDDDGMDSDGDEKHTNARNSRQPISDSTPGQHRMEVDDSGEDSSDSSDDEDELTENAPLPDTGETYTHYWSRTSIFWCDLVQRGLGDNDMNGSSSDVPSTSTTADPAIQRLAQRFSKDFYSKRSQ
ncbi:rRNA biogenesis protein RRP5 [Fasciola gigantica]|uniref:rRNA biogenesis protein RRP5 n=1 Tax=Fasciola gigantica TaxID=46835 RepID=A0A504YBZ7_FASGI|nr:rRNA biogenesis protein RRP5 [Fasciola gigantica]